MGVEPLITFTAITERCFDATIPIVFDSTSEKERKKARDCFDALIGLAQEFGIFPYRLDVDSQRKYFDSVESNSLNLNQKLKTAIDPQHLFSPGRYSKSIQKK